MALAEELLGRGVEVVFLGDLGGLPWAAAQLGGRGLALLPAAAPEDLAAQAAVLGLDAVVLDSYDLPPGTGAGLRRAGIRVLAIVDGDRRGLDADVYLDQNLGAETRYPERDRAEGRVLAGAAYTLLRDAVRRLPRGGGGGSGGGGQGEADGGSRDDGDAVRRWSRGEGDGGPEVVRDGGDGGPEVVRDGGDGGPGAGWGGGGGVRGRERGEVPRVLCFFGGTDAARVMPGWLGALAATGVPYLGTAIGGAEVVAPDGAPIEVIPPTDRLPLLMARADLVVTAAGSAIWELLYLGVPAALTWVAGNQLIGYEAVVGRGLAAGLGTDPRAAVPLLRRLIADPAARGPYGRRGRDLVDGRGRERVADALLDLTGHRRPAARA
ncbi:hypothetical protein [Microtetraspora sp. NBRC 13810]|uniref:hypothetical protein n=1 Tax=Microtetraspora sp. NBRC 13810 TaxID=3030990 RepID=UPI0025554DFF|nr:hypothetical protein [Microtetraspora sp. NBRC 13810]